MKQKRLFVVISIIALMPLFGGIVFATNLASISNWSFSDSYLVTCGEGKNINYTLDEFIEMYKKSGAYYKSIDVSFSLNDLYLAQLDSQLSVQNGIITQYRQSISQYETQISYYQNIMDSYAEDSDEWKEAKSNRDTCLINLQTYESYLNEALVQKADIYVQRENYQFIKNNKDILRSQEQQKKISEIKEKCFSLIVLKENYNLANSSVDYNSLLYQISRANLYQGRATQIDVDYYEAEFMLADNNRESVLSSYNNLFKHIIRIADISENQNTGIRFDIKSIREHKLISFDTVYNSFIQNDIKTKQMENNISIIDGKIDILDDFYNEQASILEIENKQKDIAVMELDKWLIERRMAINNLYSDYKSKYDAVNLREKKTSAQYKKYTVALNKHNLGLISGIELEEAKLKLRQSELEAWQALYEYIKAYDAIKLAMLGLI